MNELSGGAPAANGAPQRIEAGAGGYGGGGDGYGEDDRDLKPWQKGPTGAAAPWARGGDDRRDDYQSRDGGSAPPWAAGGRGGDNYGGYGQQPGGYGAPPGGAAPWQRQQDAPPPPPAGGQDYGYGYPGGYGGGGGYGGQSSMGAPPGLGGSAGGLGAPPGLPSMYQDYGANGSNGAPPPPPGEAPPPPVSCSHLLCSINLLIRHSRQVTSRPHHHLRVLKVSNQGRHECPICYKQRSQHKELRTAKCGGRKISRNTAS